MDVGIPVEVEGAHGEFYPGIVCGLNSTEEYRVKLLDSSHSNYVAEVTLPPSSMRLPPDLTNFPFDPIQGQEVDVLIPSSATPENSGDAESSTSPISKLSAWWPGRVKKVGGGFVIVELASAFSVEAAPIKNAQSIDVTNGRVNIPPPSSIEKTDIVEKHQLRPRSHQTNFSAASFNMHPIDIPDELETYCREPANYQHFARRCGLPVLVCMAPEALQPSVPVKSEGDDTYERKARLMVISTDVSTVKRAAVIDNTFIDMLRQKVLILQQTEELSRKLEASRVSQIAAPFVEDVFVPENLIPYAIGFQGSNIRRATSVDGVLSIKLNRPACLFRISGKTMEAVQQAKAMLDYMTEVVPVPRTYVGPIVGSGQRHIQHIVDCVGLSGLKICDMPEAEEVDEFVAFQLTGTSQAIRDARMFLEFHVASLQDLDRLRGVKSPPSMPPPKEPSQENDVAVEEPESSGDAATVLRPPRRGGRSSQRDRRRRTPLATHPSGMSNGDVDAVDSEGNDAGQPGDMVNPVHLGGSTSAPRSRPDAGGPGSVGASRINPRSRQRRPQYMQSNNNAPVRHDTQNGPVPDHCKMSNHFTGQEGPPMVNGTGPRPSRNQPDPRADLCQSKLAYAPVANTVM